jgi:thiamine biosynthesis lipoprotein
VTALRRVEQCMGTVFSFDVRAPGVDPGAIADAITLLHELDARFSTYRPDSEICRIRRGELALADAHPDVRFVLAECERWQAETRGYFSAFATGSLDPSGYVKGWAIERASELLRAAGSRNHCVNGGGDVQCVGTAGDGNLWRVGVSDPRVAGSLITAIAGADLAVATSGTTERGGHIIDPHTRLPAETGLLSLSVTGRSVTTCDVYATAGYAMGAGARSWLSSLNSVRAFGVDVDGTTWSTFPAAPAGPAGAGPRVN